MCWFDHYCNFTPVQNNGIEGTNKHVKCSNLCQILYLIIYDSKVRSVPIVTPGRHSVSTNFNSSIPTCPTCNILMKKKKGYYCPNKFKNTK